MFSISILMASNKYSSLVQQYSLTDISFIVRLSSNLGDLLSFKIVTQDKLVRTY